MADLMRKGGIWIAAIVVILALPLVVLLLPFFNDLADKTLKLSALNAPFLLLVLVGMTGVVGVVAGSYPAFFLARFAPLRTLRGKLSLEAGNPRSLASRFGAKDNDWEGRE